MSNRNVALALQSALEAAERRKASRERSPCPWNSGTAHNGSPGLLTALRLQAPQAGEIVSFNIEDGVAVEYKEVVVEMAPFFGGHIIGDKKYA